MDKVEQLEQLESAWTAPSEDVQPLVEGDEGYFEAIS